MVKQMFKKIIISILLGSSILLYQEASSLETTKEETSKASSIVTKNYNVIPYHAANPSPEPCSQLSDKNDQNCILSIINPDKKVNDIFKATKESHKITILKNGKEVTADLTFTATISFPDQTSDSDLKKSVTEDLKKTDSATSASMMMPSSLINIFQDDCMVVQIGGRLILVNCTTYTSSLLDCRKLVRKYGKEEAIKKLHACARHGNSLDNF